MFEKDYLLAWTNWQMSVCEIFLSDRHWFFHSSRFQLARVLQYSHLNFQRRDDEFYSEVQFFMLLLISINRNTVSIKNFTFESERIWGFSYKSLKHLELKQKNFLVKSVYSRGTRNWIRYRSMKYICSKNLLWSKFNPFSQRISILKNSICQLVGATESVF